MQQAITTHIDILASNINELLKSQANSTKTNNKYNKPIDNISSRVANITLKDDEVPQNYEKIDDEYLRTERKTLENVYRVLNNEIKNFTGNQLTLMKKCKELEEHVGKLDEEKKEMEKQLLLKNVTITEQEMRLQVR